MPEQIPHDDAFYVVAALGNAFLDGEVGVLVLDATYDGQPVRVLAEPNTPADEVINVFAVLLDSEEQLERLVLDPKNNARRIAIGPEASSV
jgi:hypothetical protein